MEKRKITDSWNGLGYPEVSDLIREAFADVYAKLGDGAYVETTWAELKALRDNAELKAGTFYRVTDYVATTTQENTRSAGHAFDIIVAATGPGTLSEEALAIQHEGDSYFRSCNLAAWRLLYSLDNDTTRFLWADAENGKGVVYRMIDDWGNDIPFDFKSIQFKRVKVSGDWVDEAYEDTDVRYLGIPGEIPSVFEVEDEDDFIWAYVFNGIDDEEDYSKTRDVSVSGFLTGDEYDPDGGYPFSVLPADVEMKPHRIIVTDDNGIPQSVASLNNIVFVQLYYQTSSYNVKGTTFGAGCYNMTIGSKDSYGNTFGADCHDNTFGNSCSDNQFGNGLGWNTFGNDCGGNTFGNGFQNNTFGNDFQNNTFGNNCSSNTFGNDFQNNTFGNDCYRNQFGNNVQHGAVGQGVSNVSVTNSGSSAVQYFYILSGTQGTGSNKLRITLTAGVRYAQFAGLDSGGNLQVWTPANNA